MECSSQNLSATDLGGRIAKILGSKHTQQVKSALQIEGALPLTLTAEALAALRRQLVLAEDTVRCWNIFRSVPDNLEIQAKALMRILELARGVEECWEVYDHVSPKSLTEELAFLKILELARTPAECLAVSCLKVKPSIKKFALLKAIKFAETVKDCAEIFKKVEPDSEESYAVIKKLASLLKTV